MFGMGTGGSLRLLSPEIWGCQGPAPLRALRRSAPSPPGFRRVPSLPFRTLKTAQVGVLRPSDLDRLPPPSTFSLTSLLLRSSVSRFDPSASSPRLTSSPLSTLQTPLSFQDQALDRLVSPSSIHCCTSTDDLSTLSSSRGLTCSWQWQFSSLGGLHA